MSFTLGLIKACVRNPVFANLAALGILVGGAVTVRELPRETFPETAIDHLTVTVPYPGASPVDIEEGICRKIEQVIEGIPGIWEISSISQEDSGVVVAAFDPSITPTAEVLRQVQDRVNTITTFPPEAERPIVQEALIRNRVINVGVHGQAPEATIKRIAEEIRLELMAMKPISQVSISGVRAFEISIQLSEEALQRYGLSLQQVINTVSQSSLDLPAGTIRTKNEEINVRTIGQRYTAREFEELVIIARPDGTTVRLGQIAEVEDTFEESPVFGRINGEPGAMIQVSKTAQEDTTAIASAVRRFVAATQPNLPEGISLSIASDASRDIDARLQMLVRNGLMGMALVLVCLLLFMDFRSAMAVSLGIPVSFAGAMVVIGLTGGTLNMISLLGLLMATGIIVDDAIVIAESTRASERDGLSPDLAAVEGTRRVASPVLMSSLTTIVAFVPLMYVKGVMGKLIYVLPVVVIAAIIASAFEAFVILPAHLREWGNADDAKVASWRRHVRAQLDHWIDWAVNRLYEPLLQRCHPRRLVVLGVAAAMVFACIGLVAGGRTPFVLFPKIDSNTLRARIRFPEGTPAAVSRKTVQRMEQTALAMNQNPALEPHKEGKLVQQVYSVVGEWAEFVPVRGSSLCETTIELMPAEDRRVDSAEIIEHWRHAIGDVPDAISMSITRQELGPTDKPIEIRLLGDDLDELRASADELEAKLESFAGVFDVQDDLLPGKRELQVSLKPEAHNLGLTVADLAAQLRQGLFGGEAVTLQRGTEEVKAIVSYTEADRRSLSAIERFRIRTQTGEEIPFGEIASTKMVRGYASIGRQDGRRRIRVQADVDERHANAEQIVQALEAGFLPALDRNHAGVNYVIDGQRKRMNESLRSLVSASVVAFAVIYALLGTVLRSYLQPVIIMAAIPLGFVGSILGHNIMGYEITLMSVFGMVALAGIVVNDSLVLVDRININVGGGMNVAAAVVDAGCSRFRAVIVTSLTTVAGLLPLLSERSSQAQSLIPMAISLAFGLIFATILTLLVVPSLFMLTNDLKRFAHWLRHGGAFPAAERVERAARDRMLPAG